jgi:phospholipase D1/2
MSRVPTTLEEENGSDADADAEETADEGVTSDTPRPKKKRRRMRLPRRNIVGAESAPNTPHMGPTALDVDDSPIQMRRLDFTHRRATMGDVQDGIVSEGEGRERLRDRAWRRGASFVTGNRSPGAPGDYAGEGNVVGPSERRITHARRRSAFTGSLAGLGGGGISDGDTIDTPKRPFFNTGRASTYGAQKWKAAKDLIRQLRQKKDDRFDYHKSAELVAELRAGAPAVLMLASMLQRDEHGNRRIPVLLEQIKVRITDSRPAEEDGDLGRHWLFTIGLEYGSGASRMRWTVVRSVRDIYNLHWKYKFTRNSDNAPARSDSARLKQPKFPWVAFPYLRKARNVNDWSDEEEEATATAAPSVVLGDDGQAESVLATTHEAASELDHHVGGAGDDGADDMSHPPQNNQGGGQDGVSDAENRLPRRKSRGLLGIGMRRRSTAGLTDQGEMSGAEGAVAAEASLSKLKYAERQRKCLEKYLQELIRWLMFRPDSNRLCRFLELSALGVRLAAEGTYHGKECYLHIQSSKGLDFRRVLTPRAVMARHTRKWFLVRQSYIVCVESPENMNVYDVYLVDSKFRIASKPNALKKQLGWLSRKKPKTRDGDGGDGGDDGEAHDDGDEHDGGGDGDGGSQGGHNDLSQEQPAGTHHRLMIYTSERKVKLFSRYHTVMKQFEEAINAMVRQTSWSLHNRFDSFAPVRTGVFAQWLVDGRDYMWNVSRAISMARDVIYIHDWWLSPELYLRRPAAISQKWRLDRLLQRKAREGVRVFVIVYRNVERAIPIDSEYTKHSLLNLHPNIFVQRSPNQLKKNQFFFAHHEKLVIVDHDVAFVGGIDLCYGRWDCPQHPISDDKPTGFEDPKVPGEPVLKDAEHCQLYPGKDYSNPRVRDFFRLHEPYEEMYDRSVVPRMPWHDIAMQVVGQPARDMTRHFVQRWNYLRRGRKPTRPLPFLLPPPDARRQDLTALGLTGTCEVQMLRSAGEWSSGIVEPERSIQTAYLKMIEDSEHFIYIENQFFISSTAVDTTPIENRIGDALVRRIERAHENGEAWRAVILIPLLPGFESEADHPDGTSIRLIVHCQYATICRGPDSIFGRLLGQGIDPTAYIEFYSLRQCGAINGVLKTEQLYIHAKCIIADDRVALIGSANINERSMMGDRDSEVAAIVRDTDMIQSRMAGKPYLVGRFAHTLRMRLMREHLGLDVDAILEQERQADIDAKAAFEQEMSQIYHGLDDNTVSEKKKGKRRSTGADASASTLPSNPSQLPRLPSFNHEASDLQRASDSDDDGESGVSPRAGSPTPSDTDPRVQGNSAHEREVDGYGLDRWKSASATGLDQGRDSVIVDGREVLVRNINPEGRGTLDAPVHHHHRHRSASRGRHQGSSQARAPTDGRDPSRSTDQPPPRSSMGDETSPYADAAPPSTRPTSTQPPSSHPLVEEITPADIGQDCMRDPLDPTFVEDVWNRVAGNNTLLYRCVFRCQPDSDVLNWTDYQMAKKYNREMVQVLEGDHGSVAGSADNGKRPEVNPNAPGAVAAAGISAPGPIATAMAAAEKAVEHVPGVNISEKNTAAGNTNTSPNMNPTPTIVTPDDHNSGAEMDEKAAVRSRKPRPENIDTEKLAAASRPPDQPFPDMSVPNDTQFPAYDGAASSLPAATLHPSDNSNAPPRQPSRERHTTFSSLTRPRTTSRSSGGGTSGIVNSVRHRKRATTKGSVAKGIIPGLPGGAPFNEMPTRDEAEELIGLVQGTLVQFPYRWLEIEDENGNWGYPVDGVAPLAIYD